MLANQVNPNVNSFSITDSLDAMLHTCVAAQSMNARRLVSNSLDVAIVFSYAVIGAFMGRDASRRLTYCLGMQLAVFCTQAKHRRRRNVAWERLGALTCGGPRSP
jgi:hypothetical protein